MSQNDPLPSPSAGEPAVDRPAPDDPALVADIGGTNARFALVDRHAAVIAPHSARTLPVAGFGSLGEAAQRYLQDTLGADRQGWPRHAAIAVATAITGDAIRMTNSPWAFSIAALRRELGLDRLLMLNDFTALAWSLLSLGDDDMTQVGGGSPLAGQPRALIGPGTGLGVSGLVPTPDGDWVALQSEGGHCTLSPADARETAIVLEVWRQYPHVSFERLVCGTGLPLLLSAVARVDGLPFPTAGGDEEPISPAWITAQALAGDALCVATMQTFCAMLGTAAGNLALTLGARGGVYLGGGIIPRLGDWFATTPFRERFEAKGRFRDYLSAIPAYVIRGQATDPALIGAGHALRMSAARPDATT